jgi:hypothetical protein
LASTDDQRLWFQTNANQLADTRARQVISQTGAALPCVVQSVTGSIVTVTFECTFTVYQNGIPVMTTLPPLTLPKAEAQWLRAPTQVGDFGITVPAGTFLGAISGMGSGTANLETDYGNLSTLVWFPIGNLTFGAMPDANKPWINGPTGAVVGDTAQTVYTLHDSTGKTVNVVVPTSGGVVALGALASSLSSTNNAAQRYVDQVAFAASIKQMVGNALQQAAQSAIAAGVTNATAWLAEIQSGLPSLSFTDLASSIASLAAPAGSGTVLIK